MGQLPKSAPLPTAAQEFLLVGILGSLLAQGKFTPEVAKLPGMARALTVVAREAEE